MNRGQRPVLVLAILLLLSIITALIVEYFTGSAATASVKISTPKLATSASAPPTLTSHTYQTTGSHVNVRQGATTGSAIVTFIPNSGSSVTLSCYLSGQSIFGDTSWYLGTYGSQHGYISGYWLNTGPDPAANALPHC